MIWIIIRKDCLKSVVLIFTSKQVGLGIGLKCVRGYLAITSYFVSKPNTYSLLLVYIGNIYGRGAEMNLEKTRKILLLGTLLSLLFTFSAYATEYTATAGVNTAFTEEQLLNMNANASLDEQSTVDWLSAYKEVTEEELRETLGDRLEKDAVVSAVVNANTGNMYIRLTNGDCYKTVKASKQFITYLKLAGVEVTNTTFIEEVVTEEPVEGNSMAVGNEVIAALLLLGMLFVPCYLFYQSTRKEPVSLGKIKGDIERVNEGIPTVKFDDVEGIEELKSDIMRLVDCLKNPKKYQKIGARTPKGVILYGPPGTGKTLIAKAIAGEASVPFFSAVGSDFVEKYVGVGASRVRELYKKAKKAAPCIVFIDEIDAVASQRGEDNNSERDQTINALLAELDGFKSTDNIITICATNRLDLLDDAFKRAGRFDLKLAVGLPDKHSREKILEIHSRGKKLDKAIDLKVIANKTTGFSGADLEALLNEAAMVAVGKNKDCIDYSDIDDAYFKIVMQGNKKKRDKITETNKVVAWHEAGHTLATKLLTDDVVSSVTIIGSSSGAGGVTFRNPREDNVLQSKRYLENTVKVMYAGRAAEQLYFNDDDSITIGASQDIKQATSIIKDYIALYGMGDKGMLDMRQFGRDYKEVIGEAADMSMELYNDVVDLLKANYDLLKTLAEELLQKETLEELEINQIIDAHNSNSVVAC